MAFITPEQINRIGADGVSHIDCDGSHGYRVRRINSTIECKHCARSTPIPDPDSSVQAGGSMAAPGRWWTQCARCGDDVWLSSGRPLVAECDNCLRRRTERENRR